MKICVLGAALAATSGLAFAGQTNLIQNGSFEAGMDLIPTGVGYVTVYPEDNAISGWTITRGSVDLVGWWPEGEFGFWSEWFWEPTDGNVSLDLAGLQSGAVQQTINTEAGRDYTLSFDLGGNWGGDNEVKVLEVIVGGESTLFQFDATNSDRGNMLWSPQTLNFRAAGALTTISFGDIGNSRFGAVLDNVSVTLVPAPGAAALGLMGGCTLARRRRRN